MKSSFVIDEIVRLLEEVDALKKEVARLKAENATLRTGLRAATLRAVNHCESEGLGVDDDIKTWSGILGIDIPKLEYIDMKRIQF